MLRIVKSAKKFSSKYLLIPLVSVIMLFDVLAVIEFDKMMPVDMLVY